MKRCCRGVCFLWAWSVALAATSLVAEDAPPAARELREFQRQQLSDRFYCEGAAFGDLNRDGKMDVVAGPHWYAGPDFEQVHEYYPPKAFDPNGYSDNFFAYTYDFNRDGWTDILILGFPGKEGTWYENPQGKPGHWPKHVAVTNVDNESPTFADLTGDGRPEIVCSQKGFFGWADWDAADPAKPWTFHRLSDNSAGGQFTHGLGVGDVNGDGKPDLLEKNGWREQPASLAGDPLWKKHAFGFCGGGAQMFAYDVNGDGRNDVLTSLAAHGYGLVWWEQLPTEPGKSEPSFKQHAILGDKPADNPYGVCFSQLHAIDLVDMDGDGLKDIVTGKRWWAHGPKGDPEPLAAAVLYWFRLTRDKEGTVEYIPHKIDDDSGVGTQVMAGDINGDGRPDVVVGNKKGIFVHTQTVRQVSQEAWDEAQPRKRPVQAQGLSPAEAARAMTVPPGFSVQLFAGEPDVQQPIAMALDDRGRVWVAEAYSYPTRQPDDKAKDRILIFEDVDGDGRFDTRKVFAEGLNLVSGLELGFGGVWVGAAPYLLFIPDANRDDVPDGPPQVLLDGWGHQDTHETLNSFIWGPDGWLYGCHGVFTHSNVGKPGAGDAQRTKINAGVWRYHPVRHEFEVFAEGTSNPWGLDFNDKGDAFITACVIPHLYHMIPGGRYQRQAGSHFNPHTYDDIKTIALHRHWVGNQWNNDDRSKSDGNGGGHAHAGAMIYLGGAWPEKYRNQLFMNNIHGARLNLDLLATKGSGYEGRGAPDFLHANDVWSQILYLTYGPDGQVYMIDWYDKNQCHHGNNEAHDRTNGRIFKITYGKAEPSKGAARLDLAALSDRELEKLVFHSNEWYSRHARRLMHERASRARAAGTDAGLLGKQTKDRLVDPQQLKEADTQTRLRSLWAYHLVRPEDSAMLRNLLQDAHPELRAWSLRLLFDGQSVTADRSPPDNLRALSDVAQRETHPVVQLSLLSALQRVPAQDRWEAIEAIAAREPVASDHNLPLMLWYAAEPCVMLDPSRALKLAFSTKVPTLARFIVRRAAAEDAAYEALFTALSSAPAADRGWMLEEITTALQTRGQVTAPKAWTETYAVLMKSPDDLVRQRAESIAVKFGDRRVFAALRSVLADRTLPSARRELALESLVAGKDAELPPVLYSLLSDDVLRSKAIVALGAVDHPQTATTLIGAYPKFSPDDKQSAIGVLAARPATVLLLLEAMEQQHIPRNDLSAFRVRQIARMNNAAVTKRLNDVWGALRDTPADKAGDLQTYRELLTADQLKLANLSRGRELYNKTCAACHLLFGAGKQIGPDLTGSNRANLDYLLENLIDPSAVVGRDYQMTTFATRDGRVINGLVKQENAETVSIQTPTELLVLPKADIEERKLSPLSLMPEGQLKQLPPGDARDLVAYLGAPQQVPLPGEGPYLDPKTRKVANALEGEKLKIAAKSGGNAAPQSMSGFTAGRWSGDEHLWWTGAKPGDTLELAWPVAAAGSYEVFVVLTKAIDYGEVQLYVNGTAVGGKIDNFNNGVVNTPPLSLGVHTLAAGEQRLKIQITGANPKAVKGYMVGVDYIWLVAK